MERIYEWSLSVGYGPGPSVVNSSVIFIAPLAPLCLPVAPACTHPNLYIHINSAQGRCMDSLFLYRNQVIAQSCSHFAWLFLFFSFFFLNLSYYYKPVHFILNVGEKIRLSLHLSYISKASCLASM